MFRTPHRPRRPSTAVASTSPSSLISQSTTRRRSCQQMAPLLVQIARRGTTVNRSALRNGAGLIPGQALQGPSCRRGNEPFFSPFFVLSSFRVLPAVSYRNPPAPAQVLTGVCGVVIYCPNTAPGDETAIDTRRRFVGRQGVPARFRPAAAQPQGFRDGPRETGRQTL
jgi:hypothetical protein